MSKTKRYILAVTLIVFGGFVFLQSEGTAATVIMGFGDSITQGFPYVTAPPKGEQVGGYEPYLERLFRGQAVVLNYGYGGEPTSDGVNRLENILSKNTADYILILEGTNDYFYDISSQTTISNLGIMVDKARTKGIEPILSTLTPDTETPQKRIPEIYNPAIVDLAKKKSVSLCDQYSILFPWWSRLTTDGVHPNDWGYRVMAWAWWRVFATPTSLLPEELP